MNPESTSYNSCRLNKILLCWDLEWLRLQISCLCVSICEGLIKHIRIFFVPKKYGKMMQADEIKEKANSEIYEGQEGIPAGGSEINSCTPHTSGR